MPKKKSAQLKKLSPIFKKIGANIRLARKRRKISTTLLAENSDMTRVTLRSIEKGEPTVRLAAYAMVLLNLGLAQDLELIARDDKAGRKPKEKKPVKKARGKRKKRR